uniref:Cilia- and flagella-associated protein 161 n=1 Tax=Macrostomum lignano TaxID=282301 RepID=A0A1I8GXQ3_9PLAT
MAHARTYNPSVRVGNWFEDCQLEEDTIKNFLEKKERGELLSQKVGNLYKSVASNSSSTSADSGAALSTSQDGLLHFGDRVQLRNPGADAALVRLGRCQPRCPSVLSVSIGEEVLSSPAGALPDPSPASAAQSCQAMGRNVFTIVSVDGTPEGKPVTFNQPFQLATHSSLGKPMFLSSDRVKFGDTPRKHGKQAVGEPLILKHAKTNQGLAVEDKFVIRGLMGTEFDVSSQTYFTDHKAETDANHWVFAANCPPGATGAAASCDQ